VYGVKKFHQFLCGRRFTLYTDHKPLTTILGPKKGIPPLAATRLQRWALILSTYTFQIEYKPTQAHANADGLSRLSMPMSASMFSSSPPFQEVYLSDPDVFNIQQMEALPVTSEQLRNATWKDPVLSRVVDYTKRGWLPAHQLPEVLRPYSNRRNEITLVNDCVMWGVRDIVPKKLQDLILLELHTSHPGIGQMKALARSYVWWPKLDQDIECQAKCCKQCQQVRSSPAVAPLHP